MVTEEVPLPRFSGKIEWCPSVGISGDQGKEGRSGQKGCKDEYDRTHKGFSKV